MPFKRVPRLREFGYRGGYRYFVTICTASRQRIFVAPDVVHAVLSQLARTAHDFQFAVIAYCCMPDHLHLLVEGTSTTSSLREFVRVFKQRSAYHWRRTSGGELWQRSYFEHVLREDEETISVARYVLANPLRAGLVEKIEDYPFVGSMTLSVADLLYSVSTST